MKNYLLYILFLVGLCACTKDDTDSAPKVVFDVTEMVVTDDGDTKQVTFKSSGDWKAYVDNKILDWCTVTPAQGKAGDGTVTVTLQPNPTSEERVAIVVVASGETIKGCKIIQKQKNALILSKSEHRIPLEGGKINVEVKTNVDFEVSVLGNAADWIIPLTTRGMATHSLQFTIKANDDGGERMGQIMIKDRNSDLLDMVTVVQSLNIDPTKHYITNGIVKLGVDLLGGGSIFYFAENKTLRNLLNHVDRGRYIQQSYYGNKDGSSWAGKPWVWNPIQGGGYNTDQSPIILEKNLGTDRIYIKSHPKHWATGEDITYATMEETIVLDGQVARFHFKFSYTGTTVHGVTDQEVPAVFIDSDLPNLVFYNGSQPWSNDAGLTSVVPGWLDEVRNTPQNTTEHWAAYVDDNKWGIGLYTPGTSYMTTYRNKGASGPMGGGCSYFAPVRKFAVTPGLVFEYDAYLFIGQVDEMRTKFDQIRTEKWEIDDTGYPKGHFYVKSQNDATVTESSESTTTAKAYSITTTGTNPFITTQRSAQLIAPAKVLTFSYKSDSQIPLSVSLDPGMEKKERIAPLEVSSEWKVYTYDMNMQIGNTGWGTVGSCLNLIFGNQSGKHVEIKDIQVRNRNAQEEELAKVMYIKFSGAVSAGVQELTDITDYFDYSKGYSYKYVVKTPENDPNMNTVPRPRAIADDENQLTFEYKCNKASTLWLFFKISGPGMAPSSKPLPVSTDWKSITFDLTADKATVKKADPTAFDAGVPMRFDIDGTGGEPLYIRAIKIHKK